MLHEARVARRHLSRGAERLGASLEASADSAQARLRTGDHVITVTRNWSRVLVDGNPVVLDAPVRVRGTTWLVPEAFVARVVARLGALGAGGHVVLIRAFEYAPPSVVAPFVYTQLVTVLALGYLVFGEFPDGWSLVGMAIIVLSGAWMAARQGR